MWRQFQGGKVRHWIVKEPGIDTQEHVYTALCGKTAAWLRDTAPIDFAPASWGNCAGCRKKLIELGNQILDTKQEAIGYDI
jgi:hypothetical protein